MKRFTLILLSVLILPTFLGNHNIYSSNVTINNSGNRTNLTAVENANEQEIANSNNDVFYEDEKIAVTSLTAGDFTVDGPSNGFSYASNVLTISSAGTYTISGVTITDIIVITASAEVILNNVDIKTSTRAPLEVQGNNAENASDNITATIKLKGENTLTPTGLNYAGLQLSNGANLILENGAAESETVGSLTVTGGEHGAGIGSGYKGTAGNITISGGTVTATGGKSAAGIGSGYGKVASNINYKSTAGNILISGGKVTIKAGDYAAGIGSGWWGIIGNITISGGEINVETSNADSYGNGAGIGAGRVGLAGNIEITDGTIKATGNNYGVGIGAGAYATVENIMISGGTVTASGGTYGAGIGSGYSNTTDNSNIKTITISGGTVTATGGNHGAGIGSGYSTTAGGSKIETITISGGTVTAKAGASAVGIGKGNGNNSTCTSVQITGGSVKAMDSSGTVNSISPAPTSDGKTSVYLGILENQAGVQSIIVDNVDYKVAGNHPDDNNFYLYMTGINHIIAGNGWYTASYDSSSNNFTFNIKDLEVHNEEGNLAADVCSYESNVVTINATDAEKIYTIKLRNGITQTSDRIVIKTNATIILENVNINTSTGAPLEVQGNNAENASDNITATIKLKGENTLTPTGRNYAGLQLSNGANLILNGGEYVGSLFVDASEGNDSAGIGGGNGGIAGNITIIDGLINTYGGICGGGIGSGNHGKVGNITISGGTVAAIGGSFGPGIGSGSEGAAGNITITGGEVTATAGRNGAGIGPGNEGSSVGSITITGGKVQAAGGENGTGIGTGLSSEVENITISGGTVTAKAGASAAGIGQGDGGSCVGVQITGGSVKAMDSNGTVNSILPSPKYDDSTDAQLLVLEGKAEIDPIVIDNTTWSFAGKHPDNDENLYVYLTPENHKAKLGEIGCLVIYKSEDKTFVIRYTGYLEIKDSDGNTATTGYTYDIDNNILQINTEGTYTIVPMVEGEISERIVINKTVNITLDNVNINTSTGAALEVQGNSATNASDNVTATIKLKGTNKLTTTNINCAGLQLSNGANLILENGAAESETFGSLTATGGGTTSKGGAGIGSGSAGIAGNINIKSGNITATGGYDSAGIGTGGSAGTVGNITIIGGTLKVYGGKYSAGIGSGSMATAGNITINGDAILEEVAGGSTSSAYAGAGIGAGHGAKAGYIKIENATIKKVTAQEGAAGIGAGCLGTTQDITIINSSITVTGGSWGAGIGSGTEGTTGDITISGGTVTATGGNGAAGIGSGYGTKSSVCGNITITSGTITAKSNGEGAGIGTGSASNTQCGTITITGGTVTATGGYDSAGIGTGGSKAKAGKITINGGTVVATGGEYAPGIGAGSRGSISDIGISDGNIIANGGVTSAGIGSSGFEASCGSITISGGKITATGGNGTSGTKGGSGIGAGGYTNTTVGSITISGGTVTAKAGNSAVGIGKGSVGSCTGVQITGGSVKAMDNEGNVDSISPTPTSDGTNRVYLVTLPDQSNVKEVTVSKYTVKETTVDEETGTNWGISSNHPDDTSLYLYFPEQHHKIIVNSTASSELTYYAKWLPTNKFMIMTNSTYLVTIPNTVKFTDDATATEEFTIRDVELIPPDIKKDVKVSISDINRMILTRENDPDSENPATAKFAIYKGNTTDTALKGGDTVVTAKDSGESNTETTQSVTIGVVGNQYVKAGKYTGSLTFTISLVRTMASN